MASANNNYQLRFERIGVISTDQDIGSSEVNFTLTWLETNLYAQFGHSFDSFDMKRTPLGTTYTVLSNGGDPVIYERSQTVPNAQLYQYKNVSKLPVLIQQTEHAIIGGSALSLNQVDEEFETPTKIVEYRLVLEEEEPTTSSSSETTPSSETSDTEEDPFLFLSVLLLIPILYKRRR